MRLPRFSVAKAMVVVLAIAVDCGLLRQIVVGLTEDDISMIFHGAGALLAANVLSVGLYRLSQPEKRSPFLVGFVTTGSVVVLAYFACGHLVVTESFVDRFWDAFGPVFDRIDKFLLPLAFIAFVLGLPQLLIALVGGLLQRFTFVWHTT